MTKNSSHVYNPFQFPSILSIAPGFLGLERGLETAIGKTKVVAYVEIEAFIIANLIAGMEAGILDAAPVWADLKTFQAKTYNGKIHGLTAGYPCQPFSLAGERKGEEDPRHLFPFICRTIKATRPVWAFFENVGGHLSMGFDSVYKELRSLGYAVEASLFTAEQVGAPHERERIFILAITNEYLQYARANRVRWETWTEFGRCSTRSGMENTNSESGRISECEPGQEWCKPQHSTEPYRPGETELEHTIGRRCQQCKQEGNTIYQSFKGCEQLAHAISQPGQPVAERRLDMERHGLVQTGRHQSADGPESYGSPMAHPHQPGCEAEWHSRNQEGPNDTGTIGTSTEFSHTDSIGLQRQLRNEFRKDKGENEQGRRRRFFNNGKITADGFNGWPAGPGQQQHEWEEPRTIKSGMGCTIDGYNFREDLLRAYGNSVVEQQASVAMIDLLQKHWKNIQR